MFAVQGRLHAANDGNLSLAHKQLKDAAKLHTVFSYITMLIFLLRLSSKISQSPAAIQTPQCAVFTLRLDKRRNNENAGVNIRLISQSDDKFLQPNG